MDQISRNYAIDHRVSLVFIYFNTSIGVFYNEGGRFVMLGRFNFKKLITIFMILPFFITCGIPVGGLVEATRPVKIKDTDFGRDGVIGFSHFLDQKYDLNQYYLAYRFELVEEGDTPTSSNKKFQNLKDTYAVNPDSKMDSRLYLLAADQHPEGSTFSHSGATFKIDTDQNFGQEIIASFSIEQNRSSDDSNSKYYVKGSFDPAIQLEGYSSTDFYLGRLTYSQSKELRGGTVRRSFERGPTDLLNDKKYSDTFLTIDDIQGNAKLYVHLYVLYEVFQSGAGKRQNSGEFIYIGSLEVPGI